MPRLEDLNMFTLENTNDKIIMKITLTLILLSSNANAYKATLGATMLPVRNTDTCLFSTENRFSVLVEE